MERSYATDGSYIEFDVLPDGSIVVHHYDADGTFTEERKSSVQELLALIRAGDEIEELDRLDKLVP